MFTIEDYLENISGLTVDGKNIIRKEDFVLLSIARQVFRGTALTNRQHELVKKLLIEKYSSDIIAIHPNVNEVLNNLRLPLREIDRSKYIRLVQENKTNKIEIRFPFTKKLIVHIGDLKNTYSDMYTHEKGTHKHYFEFHEKTCYDILDIFSDKNFEIDQILIDIYEKIKVIKNEKYNFIPTFSNKVFSNVSNDIQTQIKKDIGDLTPIKVLDRKRRYGIHKVDFDITNDNLVTKIASREHANIQIQPSKFSLQEVCNAIIELDRFPMLVLFDQYNKNYNSDNAYHVYDIFKGCISNEDQSVMFRTKNPSDFNTWVADKKLNNWVDNTTKCVYYNTSKIAKPILKSDWSPITCLTFDSTMDRYTSAYIESNCDLVIAYEEEISPIWKYNRNKSKWHIVN